MTAPAYDTYRDSGIDWLGKVPSHWGVSPLKTPYAIFGGATPKSEREDYWDGGVPWVTPADLSRLTSPFIGETLRTISETGLASCAASLVPADSVILSTRAPIGSIGITTASATTNQGCKALVSRGGAVSSFLAYTLSIATEQLRVRGKGTTFLELSGDELGRFKVPTPPSAEQAAIAAFLDRETGKIDALVEAQTRLIELLKEKRQAVISHAVTKGLDPAAPMKDSGVEWLGQVPAHWSIRPLKYLVSLRSGGTPSKDNPDLWGGDVPWASAKDLKTETLTDTKDHLTEQAVMSGAASLVQPGAVVVLVRGMMLARTFPVCEIGVPLAINQDLKALLPRNGLDGSFLAWALRGTEAETLNRLDEAGHGTKALRMEAWLSLPVPVPPMHEQRKISAELVEALAKLAGLTGQAQAAIALLQERRAALISAAVTGKIDVRGLAPAQAEAA